jgi:hypothetical protein
MHCRHFLIGSILLLAFGCTAALCQEDSLESKESRHHHWFRFMTHRSPALGLSYGWAQSSLDGAAQSLYSPRTAEIRLGGIRQDESDESEDILEHRHDYVFLGVASQDLGQKPARGEIAFTSWRVGGGWEAGYGYALGGRANGPSISLLTSKSIQWTNLTLEGGISNGADSVLLGSYENGMRFGTRSGAVVRLHILPVLAVDASYERSVVYRRHKFWEWLGSAVVEGGADGLLDKFVERILRSTPEAAPVVNFVLKNAVSYGIYELRKKDGAWPFASEAPMSNSAFTVGLTFVF